MQIASGAYASSAPKRSRSFPTVDSSGIPKFVKISLGKPNANDENRPVLPNMRRLIMSGWWRGEKEGETLVVAHEDVDATSKWTA